VSAGKQRIGPSKRCALSRFSSETRRSGGLAATKQTFRTEEAAPVAFGWRSRSCGSPRRSPIGRGSLAFAAPLLAFTVSGATPGSFPTEACLRVSVLTSAPSPSPRVRRARNRAGRPEPPPAHANARRLELAPSCLPRTRSFEVPFSGIPAAVHSPYIRRCTFGPWLPSHDIAFRPRGFAPPRRLSPHRGSRACCIPVPDMGFAAFHDRQATTAEAVAAGGRAVRLPKEEGPTRILAATTLRRFDPRRQPCRIAAADALLSFLRARHDSFEGRLRVLRHRRGE